MILKAKIESFDIDKINLAEGVILLEGTDDSTINKFFEWLKKKLAELKIAIGNFIKKLTLRKGDVKLGSKMSLMKDGDVTKYLGVVNKSYSVLDKSATALNGITKADPEMIQDLEESCNTLSEVNFEREEVEITENIKTKYLKYIDDFNKVLNKIVIISGKLNKQFMNIQRIAISKSVPKADMADIRKQLNLTFKLTNDLSRVIAKIVNGLYSNPVKTK